MRISIKYAVPDIALLGCYSDWKKGTAQRYSKISSINIFGIEARVICEGFMKKVSEINEISA